MEKTIRSVTSCFSRKRLTSSSWFWKKITPISERDVINYSLISLLLSTPFIFCDTTQKIEKPFLEAVKETLEDRYTDNIENIYRITIKTILQTMVNSFDKNWHHLLWTFVIWINSHLHPWTATFTLYCVTTESKFTTKACTTSSSERWHLMTSTVGLLDKTISIVSSFVWFSHLLIPKCLLSRPFSYDDMNNDETIESCSLSWLKLDSWHIKQGLVRHLVPKALSIQWSFQDYQETLQQTTWNDDNDDSFHDSMTMLTLNSTRMMFICLA